MLEKKPKKKPKKSKKVKGDKVTYDEKDLSRHPSPNSRHNFERSEKSNVKATFYNKWQDGDRAGRNEPWSPPERPAS